MVSLLSGDNFNIPCEVMETRFPTLLAESYRLRAGSAGAGKHRGGWGVAYDYRALVPLEMSVALDHFAFPPYGLFGGAEGEPSALVLDPGADGERVMHQAAGVPLAADTVVSHRTAGGGGYGDPRERVPEAVAEDVRNQLLTPAAAREQYGVVLAEDGEPDLEATAAARARSDHP
jgi:N-methylhydantoinase B